MSDTYGHRHIFCVRITRCTLFACLGWYLHFPRGIISSLFLLMPLGAFCMVPQWRCDGRGWPLPRSAVEKFGTEVIVVCGLPSLARGTQQCFARCLAWPYNTLICRRCGSCAVSLLCPAVLCRAVLCFGWTAVPASMLGAVKSSTPVCPELAVPKLFLVLIASPSSCVRFIVPPCRRLIVESIQPGVWRRKTCSPRWWWSGWTSKVMSRITRKGNEVPKKGTSWEKANRAALY